MRIYLLSIFLIFSLSANEKLKVCYLEWGNFGGKNLPDKGMYLDYSKRILEEAGYEVETSVLPWNRCLKLVELKRFDMVAAIWHNDQYKKIFNFFEPLAYDHLNFISLKTFKAKYEKIEDFYGKSIGIMRGTGGGDSFHKVKHKFKLFEVNEEAQLLELLKSGRIDAIVNHPEHTFSLVEKSFPELVGKLKIWKPSIQINIASSAIAKDHPRAIEIETKYDKALKKLLKQGIYEKMLEKHHLKFDYEGYNE